MERNMKILFVASLVVSFVDKTYDKARVKEE